MRRPSRIHLVCGALGILFTAPVPTRASAARQPNIVLVVVDTLRADRLAAYGDTRDRTPFLTDLARRATVFANAYTASTWTVPSVASLFTSRYPTQHQVAGFQSHFAPSETLLAERLSAMGYLAGGFTANFQLDARAGYDRGFHTWTSFPSVDKLPAEDLRREALAWIDANRPPASDRPVFLFLQFMEPHSPYRPPATVRERLRASEPADVDADVANGKLVGLHFDQLSPAEVTLLELLYDEEVMTVDSELRQLFDDLAARHLLDGAIVIVTSDHGEEFMEHRLLLHGFTLYEQALRVPLLLLLPGDPGGSRVTANVSLIDVAPTLLDVLGAASEPRFEGRSLVPLLHSGAAARADADVVAELLYSGGAGDWRQHSAVLIRGTSKLILPSPNLVPIRAPEWYDLGADPAEAAPDPPYLAATANALEEALCGRLEVIARDVAGVSPGVLGDEERARLRALGYVQ